MGKGDKGDAHDHIIRFHWFWVEKGFVDVLIACCYHIFSKPYFKSHEKDFRIHYHFWSTRIRVFCTM